MATSVQATHWGNRSRQHIRVPERWSGGSRAILLLHEIFSRASTSAGIPIRRELRPSLPDRGERLDPTEVVSNVVLVWGAPYVGLAALLQRNVNTIDQRGTRKRLRQQADGPGLQCSGADTLAWERP